MTAPDPRPYAGPTDLVTAEDVARWLDTLHQGPPAERIFGVQDAVAALDARLARERRQACRRGALAEWREVCEDLDYSGLPRMVWDGADTFAEAEHVRRLLRHLTRALAFRAAARAW